MKKKLLFSVLFILLLSVSAVFAEEENFVPGIKTETAYENASLGIRCEIPDEYFMATDEQIQAMFQTGVDLIYEDSEDGQQLLNISEVQLFYDMLAMNQNDGSSMTVIAEKPAIPGFTLDLYITANLTSIKSMPVEISDVVTDKAEFCGQELKYLSYVMDYSGVNIYYRLYFMQTADRFAIVNFSGLSEEVLDKMEGFFTAYEETKL